MASTTISIKKEEYGRLKKLDKSFGKLFDYMRGLLEISEARKQVKERKTIDQERLFRKLGI